MIASEASTLMHAVLDGEATPSETAALERELAEHSELNAHFAALQNLFEDLRRIPMGYPPEGLVASVMANIPQNRTESDDERQLFTGPGVLGASSQGTRGRRRDESRAGRIEVQPWLKRMGKDMSDKNQGFPSKRKWWIGGGIAAAVVVIGLASGVIPPNGKDTAGTIVPAQRYQAPQSAVQDVQGGGVGDGTSQTSAAVDQPVDAAANAGALNSGDRGGLNSGDRGGMNSGDRGGMNSGDRGGMNSGDRGGMNSGDRGGLNSGDRGGLNSGDRGGVNSGDRGGLNSGDRGGLNSGDRGGLNSGDRGGLNSGDRGGLNSGDRFSATQ